MASLLEKLDMCVFSLSEQKHSICAEYESNSVEIAWF